MKMKAIRLIAFASTLTLLVAAWVGAGCQTVQSGGTTGVSASSASGPAKGGAQLWAESCVRCHNIPSPSKYSDAQWDVIAHHMQVRANLTAGDATKIKEFLQSAN